MSAAGAKDVRVFFALCAHCRRVKHPSGAAPLGTPPACAPSFRAFFEQIVKFGSQLLHNRLNNLLASGRVLGYKTGRTN